MPFHKSRPRLRNSGQPSNTMASLYSSTSSHGTPGLIPTNRVPSHKSCSTTKAPRLSRHTRILKTPQSAHSESQLPPNGLTREFDLESESDDDTLNEVVMAAELGQKGTVGCCYYLAREETLYFLEDVKLGGATTVDALRVYIEPTVVLVSTRIDDTVIEILEGPAEDRFSLPFLLDVRPPGEFSFDAAKSKLAALNLEDMAVPQVGFIVPGDLSLLGNKSLETTHGQQGRLLRLAGLIDMESRSTIGCAGAVLSYLQRRRAAAFLPGDQTAHHMFRIAALKMFSLHDTMFINQDTLKSLQIMENESHPNTHNQGPTTDSSGSKEGLSVFGLFNHLAHTPQGKHFLRQYFLRPSTNPITIHERLDTIETFLRPENATAFDTLIGSLKSIGNMRTTLISLRKGITTGAGRDGHSTSGKIWTSIRRFAFHILKIRETFREMIGVQALAIRVKFFEQLEGYHLAQVGRKISDTVDFEKSDEECRTVILEGVDEELDNMKRTFAGLDDLLGTVARNLSEKLPAKLQTVLNILYFPQIGFLITVPLDLATNEAVYEGSLDNPWEHMFSTKDQVYFKNDQMREMDGHFGDLYGMISDREIEISHELAQFVLEYEQLLTNASDACGELDSILALAQGARSYKLRRPDVVNQNLLYIQGGRHLLQELSVPSFVPNDAFLVGGADIKENSGTAPASSISNQCKPTGKKSPNMLILTGPNYSGKSVYLKQVALMVYMAHIGSYVPAEDARIGITDKILSRVATRETVSQRQSAFMIDLQQISQALNSMTPRSLLVIDEFGKGTDSISGAGLACAVFKHLIGMGTCRPKVIGATHFHEIFENDLLGKCPFLTLGHMQVKIDENASEQDEQITYLYNLCEGRSNSSFGTSCAAMNGVPKEVVQRADDLISATLQGKDLIATCSIMPQSEATELIEAEQIARKFLEVDIFADPKATMSDILSTTIATVARY